MTDLTPEAVKAALEGATPGPWVIGSSEGRVLSHWEDIGYWEIANATVTDFCGYSGKAYFAGGTQKANADLIAMAPDLAREYLRIKEVEKAAQWVVDNPRAHPANMVKVCRAAVEGK